MKKRIIISAMSLMIAIGSLVGCNNAKKEDAKLTIWTNMEVEANTIQKYANEWGSKNGYKVEVTHQSPSVQQFAQAVMVRMQWLAYQMISLLIMLMRI